MSTQTFAQWKNLDGKQVRHVVFGDADLEIDLENSIDQLLWTSARDYDRETETVLREAKAVAQQASDIVKHIEDGRHHVADPATWSSHHNLTVAIARRDQLRES